MSAPEEELKFVETYNASEHYDRVFGPEQIAWFKSQTGIQTDEELKKHVIAVQEEAWSVFPYRCIRSFTFVRQVIARLPGYQQLLNIGKEQPGAIFLDFACCFGNDLRTAVAAGFPVEGAIGADLNAEFWPLGHKLFRSTPETFPAAFVATDVFNDAHIAPREPFYTKPASPPPSPLSNVTSLTELQGHISVIHVSAFFHLFEEEKQLLAAQKLATLLSPAPGSFIFGVHIGRKQPEADLNFRGEKRFHHSPESWKELWDGQIFKKGTVEVDARLIEFNASEERKVLAPADNGEEIPFYKTFLAWKVTRV